MRASLWQQVDAADMLLKNWQVKDGGQKKIQKHQEIINRYLNRKIIKNMTILIYSIF